MSVKATVLVLALVAVVAEQRILVVEVPPQEGSPVAGPADTASPAEQLDPGDAAVGSGASSTVQLTVPRGDVEALSRFLRYHYRRYLLRLFPLQHVDGDAYADDAGIQCDPDECYSHCYLQGFQSGKCKENKCFCSQAPAPTTTTTTPPPPHPA